MENRLHISLYTLFQVQLSGEIRVVHGAGYGSRWASNSHYDGTQLAGYFDMGLTCSHRFVMKHGELSLRGDIKNILNQQYEIVGNYPMPGVSYQFVVNYKF